MKPNESERAVNEFEMQKALEKGKQLGPFRRAVLRGLGILLPPLLTIVIFVWVAHTVGVYILEPLERSTRSVMVQMADIRTPDDLGAAPDRAASFDGVRHEVSRTGVITIGDKEYHRTGDGRFVPVGVYRYVQDHIGKDPMPTDAKSVYTWYIDHYWLPRRYVVPLFLCVFLLVLYLLGKFLAAGVGRYFITPIERLIHRLPLVSNVYSSIKQVTDFLFSEREMQYTRVVAIEYPRMGIWTLAFVTGEGMTDIRNAIDEPVVSAFVPHSPMPFTGFAVTVKKRDTIDLNISVDQAIQWVVSCGVVIPPPRIEDAETLDARDVQLALSGGR
jgi:uncharacterized membrane protein